MVTIGKGGKVVTIAFFDRLLQLRTRYPKSAKACGRMRSKLAMATTAAVQGQKGSEGSRERRGLERREGVCRREKEMDLHRESRRENGRRV